MFLKIEKKIIFQNDIKVWAHIRMGRQIWAQLK